MDFLSNIILAAAALGAAVYCFVLSRRLTALSSLEGGMGSAIAVLSAQVDDLTRTLSTAREGAGKTSTSLTEQTARAEAVARRLELLVASMHDLPSAPEPDLRAPPSRWTGAAATPPKPADAEPGQPRARILRRRRESGDAR
tara:strand:- start:1083 stop:1508 length:426 start_codon:yes stop_codon:yes gene_type:complete